MKPLLSIVLLVLCLSANAQVKIKSFKKIADGLHIMYYDTLAGKGYVTKSTIVEFKDYIVLIEMPISTDGAGAKNIKDHSAEGEVVLAALKEKFPNKPLKYVLSTHWHPHSISSVIPFISRGITVVTTAKNYKRIGEYIDSATFKKYGKNIRFVGDDGFTIKDKVNTITAYRLDRSEYPHMPTEDFVFYYLPKYNYLHSSCMFQRLQGAYVNGKEMISVRVEDVDKFIKAKNINPTCYITTDMWADDASGLASGDTMAVMYKNGVTMTSLENEVLSIDNTTLTTQSDKVIKSLMDKKMPNSIILGAVYTSLKKHDLEKALAVAKLFAFMNPSDPNVWDTLGEVYYFMGETQLAKKYEVQTKRINKDFTQGGEASWEKDLKEYSQQWAIK